MEPIDDAKLRHAPTAADSKLRGSGVPGSGIDAMAPRLQVVARVFAVLRQFTPDTPRLSLDRLATKLDLNKPSLLRILRSLEAENVVHRTGDTYSLGAGVLDLGHAFLATLSVHDVAKPYIEGLAREHGQTTTLAIREGADVIYVLVEHPQRDVGILGGVGQRFPAHSTAVGKVLLAAEDDAAVAALLGRGPLPRLTHRTIVDVPTLIRALDEVRRSGFAVDDEERGIGIRCVAVPILDRTGSVVAGLSLSGPIFHMTSESIPGHAEVLLATSERISRRLGYHGPIPPRPR